jgi:hypothetical protein
MLLVFFLHHYSKIFKPSFSRPFFAPFLIKIFPGRVKFFRQVLQRPGLQCLLQGRMAGRHHRSP